MADAHYRLTDRKAYLSRTTTATPHPRLLPKPTSLGRQLPSAWWTPSRQPPQRSGTAASSWAPCPSPRAPSSMSGVPLTITPTLRVGSAACLAPQLHGASEGNRLFPNTSSSFAKPWFPSEQRFLRHSLEEVRWLGLRMSTAEGAGSIPGPGS